MSTTIELYDVTLRDGAQREGISFSVEDKLRIAQKLDELGVSYIEGGWPGSNPKDEQFFQRVKSLTLDHSTIAAFGSTRRADMRVEEDPQVKALLDSGAPVITLVGKSDALHVTHVLETSLEENLSMIADTVAYLKSRGRRVFFDAEHFFDGYKRNPDYALRSIQVAEEAGAERLILCETNGGCLPEEVAEIVKAACKATKAPLGIHAHNDAELGVANSLAALRAGASQVQGTINGIGERCGNANLVSIIANLKLKLGIHCISDEQLAKLTEVSRYVAEIANLAPNAQQPFVGISAFAHKGGLHAAAEAKVESSYQHIDPKLVGNVKRVVISELSGRSNILAKAKELGISLDPRGEAVKKLLDHIKLQESRGFQYESAEASFELLLRRAQHEYQPPFHLVDFMVMVEKQRRPSTLEGTDGMLAEATVKVQVGDEIFHTAAEGNGPVNALDRALRKALARFYPDIEKVQLTDYKVRIIEEGQGTASGVRVLIESSDGHGTWRTVGSSTNIIEASWLALLDSLEYWLLRRR
jgi:2-isopropylmalate synthase